MRRDLDPLKDGEPWRDQFGPEDFEDEHDARERRAIDRENVRKAELLRIGLKRFSRNFDIRVSDDARSAAQCRHCQELIIGDRQQPAKLPRELTAHIRKCGALQPWKYPAEQSKVYEEAFS